MSELAVYSRFHIQSEKNLPFLEAEYSKFKYGSKSIARKFGKDLAEAFILSDIYQKIVHELKHMQIVVIPSPYCFIPTATFAMKDYFISDLNTHLIENCLKPAQEAKIFRAYSYNDDYGNMSAEDRRKAIGSDSFQIDTEFVSNKLLILLDDIRITGAHEERMRELIERTELSNKGAKWLFMYYAELKQTNINPKLENYLNYFAMKNLVDLNDIIVNDEFLFNTRNVKFILGSEEGSFDTFISFQSETFIQTLYRYAAGNSYHLPKEFVRNFYKLKTLA